MISTTINLQRYKETYLSLPHLAGKTVLHTTGQHPVIPESFMGKNPQDRSDPTFQGQRSQILIDSAHPV